ncbi:MAG: class I SAM-dependent methyltransferase, partial [Nitrososphaerales archaeon]
VANNAIATHLVGSSSQGTQRKKISSTLYLWNKFPHLRPQNRGLALMYIFPYRLSYPLRVMLVKRAPRITAILKNIRSRTSFGKTYRAPVHSSIFSWDIGCGLQKKDGWFGVDISSPLADLKHDIREPFPEQYRGLIEQARFYHGPEHYFYRELPQVLQNIFEILAPGAELEIRCPDIDYWARAWLDFGANRDVLRAIFGSQENEFQIHKNGFNFAYLKQELERAGFTNIKRKEAKIYSGDLNQIHDLVVSCQK